MMCFCSCQFLRGIDIEEIVTVRKTHRYMAMTLHPSQYLMLTTVQIFFQ